MKDISICLSFQISLFQIFFQISLSNKNITFKKEKGVYSIVLAAFVEEIKLFPRIIFNSLVSCICAGCLLEFLFCSTDLILCFCTNNTILMTTTPQYVLISGTVIPPPLTLFFITGLAIHGFFIPDKFLYHLIYL